MIKHYRLTLTFVLFIGILRLLHDPAPDYSLVDPAVTTKYAAADEGWFGRLLHPNRGWCVRCGKVNTDIDNWPRIQYSECCGCYPACRTCWEQADLEERLQMVKAAERGTTSWDSFNIHAKIDSKRLPLIEAAVKRDWAANHGN